MSLIDYKYILNMSIPRIQSHCPPYRPILPNLARLDFRAEQAAVEDIAVR